MIPPVFSDSREVYLKSAKEQKEEKYEVKDEEERMKESYIFIFAFMVF